MTSMEEFANELRRFNNKNEIVNELRKDLRKPVPPLRKAVRANAMSDLPARGGLNAWVAKASLGVRLKTAGRSAGIRLKLSRKSTKDKADLKALDETGRIRHPLYGNRGSWHSQQVPAGFFTKVWERFAPEWVKVADDAVDRAFDKIRRG